MRLSIVQPCMVDNRLYRPRGDGDQVDFEDDLPPAVVWELASRIATKHLSSGVPLAPDLQKAVDAWREHEDGKRPMPTVAELTAKAKAKA